MQLEKELQYSNFLMSSRFLTSPRMSTCALREMQDKLLSQEFLQEIIVQTDTCTLCMLLKQGSISFTCPFLVYTWSLCKFKLRLNGNPIGAITEEAQMIQDRFNRKTKGVALTRAAFGAAI